MRKRTWPLVAALTVVGGYLALGMTTPAPAAETPQVLMVDNEPDLTRWHYEPADITVPAGTTVVWVNRGKEDHTVTADDKSYDSGMKKSGGTFSRAFAQPGKYAYHCAPHPWMKGTVQVVAARTASAAPTPTAAAPTTTTAPAAPPVSTPAPGPAPGATAPPARSESTGAPAQPEGGSQTGQDGLEENAAPASDGDGSGGNLVGTLAVVLLPTLGALALGAKLRQSST